MVINNRTKHPLHGLLTLMFALVYIASQLIKALELPTSYYTFRNKFGKHKIRWDHIPAERHIKSINGGNVQDDQLPPIVCIHGFGGNADQFRKNMPAFAKEGYDSYAFDLLGYGYSDKPNPKDYEPNTIYNFENWAEQTCDFIKNEVKRPCVLVCNSVGGVVGLQAAYTNPELIKGVVLINISLRMLHTKKQNPIQRPFTSMLQTILRESRIGSMFFKQVATPKALKNILNVAYGYEGSDQSVDDETVDIILKPGLQPGAVEVFLDFISYSGGPLPEELLPKVTQPVSILWSENDPWEPIEMGRTAYSQFPCVTEFVTLNGGGHCPMDQIPETVNNAVLRFMDTQFQRKAVDLGTSDVIEFMESVQGATAADTINNKEEDVSGIIIDQDNDSDITADTTIAV